MEKSINLSEYLLLLVGMITPEEKDNILVQLTNAKDRTWHEVSPESLGVNKSLFPALIAQFERKGFISIKSKPAKQQESYCVSVELDSDDFLYRGGHRFEEDAFRNNFTKLELELAKLEGDIPTEKYNNIMTLMSTAAAVVSAYSSLK